MTEGREIWGNRGVMLNCDMKANTVLSKDSIPTREF